MEILHAVLYGVVEGITEFLPISSTGHLMLLTELLGGDHSAFIKSFEIMIQLGAILAIVALYPKRLLTDSQTQLRILSAFIPTALLGLLFYQLIKKYLLEDVRIVFFALFFGGVLIIIFERYLKSKPIARFTPLTKLTLPKSALLGALQCLAFIPGVSRSATTIFGGMFLGLSRKYNRAPKPGRPARAGETASDPGPSGAAVGVKKSLTSSSTLSVTRLIRLESTATP